MRSGGHLSAVVRLAERPPGRPCRPRLHCGGAQLPKPLHRRPGCLPFLRMPLPARILRNRLQFNGRYERDFFQNVKFLGVKWETFRHSAEVGQGGQGRAGPVRPPPRELQPFGGDGDGIHRFISTQLPDPSGPVQWSNLAEAAPALDQFRSRRIVQRHSILGSFRRLGTHRVPHPFRNCIIHRRLFFFFFLSN